MEQGIPYSPFSSQGWSGWVLDDWRDTAGFANLSAWLTEPQHTVILDTLCRTITKITAPQGVVYAKLMRAQNDGVLKKHELFSLFKWVCYPSRARTIFKTTLSMLQHGHLCPTPVLGVRKRTFGHLPTDLFIATEVTEPTVEQRLLTAQSDQEKTAILAICAEKLASFHADQFVHGDFLPRNICLSADNQRLYYLDNDRTRRWPLSPVFHFKRRNITQFCFNLHILYASGDHAPADAFINAYARAAHWSDSRTAAEKRLIFAQNDARWTRTGEREVKAYHRQINR